MQPCQGGPVREEHHIKYVLPADRYISAVLDYEQFGHKTNLRMNPRNIPDLQWDLTDELHILNIGSVSTTLQGKNEEIDEIVKVNTMYITFVAILNAK